MLYGFGQKGFRAFRFLMNELGEPVEVIAHSTLARMTLEGREMVFWPDMDRFLDEVTSLFPHETDGLRALYAYLRRPYEVIVVRNVVNSPPSECSARRHMLTVTSGGLPGSW